MAPLAEIVNGTGSLVLLAITTTAPGSGPPQTPDINSARAAANLAARCLAGTGRRSLGRMQLPDGAWITSPPGVRAKVRDGTGCFRLHRNPVVPIGNEPKRVSHSPGREIEGRGRQNRRILNRFEPRDCSSHQMSIPGGILRGRDTLRRGKFVPAPHRQDGARSSKLRDCQFPRRSPRSWRKEGTGADGKRPTFYVPK